MMILELVQHERVRVRTRTWEKKQPGTRDVERA